MVQDTLSDMFGDLRGRYDWGRYLDYAQVVH